MNDREHSGMGRARRMGVVGVASVMLVGAGLASSGCNNAGEGALTGAGIGALGGLAIGSLYGNAGAGAAIGAIAGGAVGGVIGDQNERNEQYHDDW